MLALGQPVVVTGPQELIEHFERHSLSRHFPGMETTLATPFRVALARKGGSSYVCTVGRVLCAQHAAGPRPALAGHAPASPMLRAMTMKSASRYVRNVKHRCSTQCNVCSAVWRLLWRASARPTQAGGAGGSLTAEYVESLCTWLLLTPAQSGLFPESYVQKLA